MALAARKPVATGTPYLTSPNIPPGSMTVGDQVPREPQHTALFVSRNPGDFVTSEAAGTATSYMDVNRESSHRWLSMASNSGRLLEAVPAGGGPQGRRGNCTTTGEESRARIPAISGRQSHVEAITSTNHIPSPTKIRYHLAGFDSGRQER